MTGPSDCFDRSSSLHVHCGMNNHGYMHAWIQTRESESERERESCPICVCVRAFMWAQLYFSQWRPFLSTFFPPSSPNNYFLPLVYDVFVFCIIDIGSTRKYLTRESGECLVHAFISSRLDCGNALLYNVPKLQLSRLQRVQKLVALVVMTTPKYVLSGPK